MDVLEETTLHNSVDGLLWILHELRTKSEFECCNCGNDQKPNSDQKQLNSIRARCQLDLRTERNNFKLLLHGVYSYAGNFRNSE